MAHFKRRKQTKRQHDGYGRKNFVAPGIKRGEAYDFIRTNVRQQLKRHIWDGWEST